jgi:hypothetical protein
MSQDLAPGDFLVFQLESGFALLRLLAVDKSGDDIIWHVAGYDEFFPDVDSAEAAALSGRLTVRDPHIALTNRAFESTQVARIGNIPLNEEELRDYHNWHLDGGEVSDRSVRLMLGLR